jgi:hypothetical protein
MREAKAILPKLGNDGSDLSPVHNWLAVELSRSFGGCTATDGRGLWIDPTGKLFDESVAVFHVAAVDTPDNNKRLSVLIRQAGAKARQLSVYHVDFGGNAWIESVEAESVEIEAAA